MEVSCGRRRWILERLLIRLTASARTMSISGTASGAGQPTPSGMYASGQGARLPGQLQSPGRWSHRRLDDGSHLLLSGGYPFQRRFPIFESWYLLRVLLQLGGSDTQTGLWRASHSEKRHTRYLLPPASAKLGLAITTIMETSSRRATQSARKPARPRGRISTSFRGQVGLRIKT